MVEQHTVEQLLALGHETRAFEVKGPVSLKDRSFRARVARAAMAMGNLRDGGLVCIGIDDDKLAPMQPGLTPELLAEWSDFDTVHAVMAPFCDPAVDFDVQPMTLSNGATVVVLDVREFLDNPHLCRRPFEKVLQQGMAYVRPRGKPESVPVPSSVEMRELLDLAITKGVREFIRRSGGAGVTFGASSKERPDGSELFTREAQQMWANPSLVMQQIQASAYCGVTARPTEYRRDRLTADTPEAFVNDQAVRMRGWPLPYVDQRQPIARHGSWIGQDFRSDRVPHTEAWRMSVSGQFLHRFVLATDTRDNEQLQPTNPDASGAVAVWDVLLHLVEVAELGARLAIAAEVSSITLEASLHGIQGRQLIWGDSTRDISDQYLVAANTLSAKSKVSTDLLLENARTVGVTLAQKLLKQFGLSVPDQVLYDWQDQVFGQVRNVG